MIRAIRIDSDRLHPLHPTTIKKKSGTKKKKNINSWEPTFHLQAEDEPHEGH
jgi:hypothetical protein